MERLTNPDIIIGGEFLQKVLPLIDGAKTSVDFIVYDLRLKRGEDLGPVAELLFSLKKAVQRGVKVRALLANAGIVAQLKLQGIEARMVYTQKLLHAKMMLIDKVVAVVGSHNYTLSAFTLNHEISVAVCLPSPRNALVDYFNNLYC